MKTGYSLSATGAFDHWTLGVCMLAAFLLSTGGNAAEPVVQWAKAMGDPGNDWSEDLAFASGEELYVVGGFGPNVLHRLDRHGALLGTQASRGEYIRGVAVDSAGNYYLTGLIRDSRRLGIGLTNDFYLAKYSSGGSLHWERTGGTPTYSNIYPWNLGGFKVALDREGNVIVAGGSTGPAVFGEVTLSATAGGPMVWKYAPDGMLLWIRRVEGAYSGFDDGGTATDFALSPDGGIVVTGYLRNGQADFGSRIVSVAGPFNTDFFVAKISSSGEFQWAQVGYGGRGVATDAKGNTYFNGNSAGVTEMHLGKFGPTGELVWDRRIPGAYGNRITLDGMENPLLSAQLYATVQLDDILVVYHGRGESNPEALFCKKDASGTFQWALTESGAAVGMGGPLLADRSGNIFVTGALRCGYAFDEYYGCTGMFGPFPLEVPHPNADYQNDFFISRLFDAEGAVPELSITPTAHGLVLSWPAQAANFLLETATSLSGSDWAPVDVTPVVSATDRSVELPRSAITCFFRLRSISNE